MMTKRGLTLLAPMAAAILLGACGQKADLTPAAGASLPPEPYGSNVRPDTQTLLELGTLAAPERSVELRRRSEERQDDPFDLPPEGDEPSDVPPEEASPE